MPRIYWSERRGIMSKHHHHHKCKEEKVEAVLAEAFVPKVCSPCSIALLVFLLIIALLGIEFVFVHPVV